MLYKTKLYILLLLSLFIFRINSSDNNNNNIQLDGFLNLNDNDNLIKSKKFNQDILIQNHILDFISSTDNEKSLKKIVKENQDKVVAISYGYGLPISSGLLLNDQYVLTFSDIANDEHFNELAIRLNYQKTKALNYVSQNETILMDYGQAVEIEGVVEVNNDIGFSILKLSNNLNTNFKKIKTSKRTQKDNKLNILFNYENSGPKKVALIQKDDIINFENINTGISFDDKGNFIGLLNENGYLIRFKDIEDNSEYFKKLLNNYDHKDIKVEKRIHYSHQILSSKRPRYPGPPLPQITPPLARHHIIPYGNMLALWQLSAEYSKIKELFYVINKEPTLQYVVWSYYNIFAGPNPSLRYHKDEMEKIFGPGTLGYDPEDSVEPLRPRSFSNTIIWNMLQDLNGLLESTYKHRSNILSSSSKSSQKVILESSLNSYNDKLEKIFNLLNENRLILGKVEALHDYVESDWAKLEKKYYLLS